MPVSNTDPQGVYSDQGVRTQYGIILPPGARVAAYVRSTGTQSGDDAFLQTNLRLTLAAGLALVRPGLGDYVICLPGHVESVTDGTTFSNALIAGTKILGVGRGGNTPTFNFTAVASQWLVNKADVVIAGLRLVSVTLSATLGIAVTAADFGFYYNDVVVAGASTSFTTFLQMQAGSDRADVTSNVFRALSLTSSTVLSIGAVADARVCDNEIVCASPSATGPISVVQAATGLKVLRNTINNTTAASVAGIAYVNLAATGQCAYNNITVLSTGAQVGGTTGITVGGTNNLTGYFQNFVVNDPNKSGILQPAADT